MRFLTCLLLIAVTVEETGSQEPFDAQEYCISKRDIVNTDYLHEDPTDCHYFYQCLYMYLPEFFAFGFRRSCATGTYWHQGVLQCMPENPLTPCNDICGSEGAPESGCYQVTAEYNPRSFFICANHGSAHFCCPMYTRFNTTTCYCDDDSSSTKPCTNKLMAPQPPTVLPPVKFNDSCCIDSQGNTLSVSLASSSEFIILGRFSSYTMTCASGTTFSVDYCQCEGPADITITIKNRRRAILYLPFDKNILDYSNSRFSTFGFGTYRIDQTQGARGVGSLYVKNGRIEIPGFKTRSFQKEGSWCAFFKSEDPARRGGVISAHSFSIAYLGNGELFVKVNFENSAYEASHYMENDFSTAQGFTQVCITYSGEKILVYENNRLVKLKYISDTFPLTHYPIVIGTDMEHGSFTGYIDEVLICDFEMTREEVSMHMGGQISLMNKGLIPMNNNHESFDMLMYSKTVTKPSPYGACGHSKYWNAGEVMNLQIVGGLDSWESEFPWQASLTMTCGGSVISERWILTAGHCCVNLLPSTYHTVTYDSLIGFKYSQETSKAISRFFIHPNFDRTSLAYDFCLLEVDSPVSFNSWAIQPACLPTSCDDPNLCDVEDLVLVSGYGAQAQNVKVEKGDRLKFVQLPLVSSTYCDDKYGKQPGTHDSTAHICAGWWQGSMDSCKGDSGGPLTCYKNGFAVLQGIVSKGAGCAEAHFPGAYAKVCLVLDWIYGHTGPIPA